MRVEMQSRNSNATLRKSLHATETEWSWANYAFIDPKAKCSLSEKSTPSWTKAAGKSLQDSEGSQRGPPPAACAPEA